MSTIIWTVALVVGLHTVAGCSDNLNCSLNGVCSAGACVCDAPWTGKSCGTLGFAPGVAKGLDGRPLCCYHGDDANSTSWGGSVLLDRASSTYYMWVAQMSNHCTLGAWRTNSEVALAKSKSPLGPFKQLGVIVKPWAHNPQTIHASDPDHGHVYALYALGDGAPVSGPPKMCNNTPPHALNGDTEGAVAAEEPRSTVPAEHEGSMHGGQRAVEGGRNITANFTIHWSPTPEGPYQTHVASILNWPSNWDYGAHGNWNPAPMVHPINGTIYLMAHTSWKAFRGEAIIRADSWKGPYTVVASDTYPSWGGTTTQAAEDPFMWVDKRGHWHVLYHYMHGACGGHAFSPDGIQWSNVSAAYNNSRPLHGGGHANYGAERPKLLFNEDGVTPGYIYNGGSKGTAWTIVSPLLTD